MRRLLAALAGALVVSAAPPPAWAAPAADLCVPDAARGGVPADFAVDACADATAMTLRNDLAVPVLVHRDGDVGTPVRVHERGSAAASILRVLGGTDELLMPGDVTRWPLGAAAAGLTVVDLDPVTAAVVDSVTRRLPELGSDDEKDLQAFAVVIRDLVAAVQARAICVDGKNFLRVASCDVDAAARISRTLRAQLPRARAVELLPVALDRGRWAAWAALGAAGPSATGSSAAAPAVRTLTQAAVPPPVVVPPPPVPAPAAPAPSGGSTRRVPAPAPVQVPAPAGTGAVDDWLAAVLSRLAAQSQPQSPSDGHGRRHH